jgi:transaldolase
MSTTLEQLRKLTTLVVDSSDFQSIAKHHPQDATTNPSLILKTARKPEYAYMLKTIQTNHSKAPRQEQVDRLLVNMGLAILEAIPGRVSTEVDARLSFDTAATIARAKNLVALYQAAGVNTNQRVLIKIAGTWEGIQAAKLLEQQGIPCNITLLFCGMQAHACAQAGVTLISPFVGRIYDWEKKNSPTPWVESEHAGVLDPGVQSVRSIYAHLKQNNTATAIMAASFRNTGQICALAGCDLMTIAPELLTQLENDQQNVLEPLNPAWALQQIPQQFANSEAAFRHELNANAMATEKLAEGIRLFAQDAVALEHLLAQ